MKAYSISCRLQRSFLLTMHTKTITTLLFNLLARDEVGITEDDTIQKTDEERVLETAGVNLKAVMCVEGVDWKRTYPNSCVETSNRL